MGQQNNSEGRSCIWVTAEEELTRERWDVWKGTERSGKCRITGFKEAEFKMKGTVTGVRAERASNTGGGTFLLDTASARSVELSPTLLGFHT